MERMKAILVLAAAVFFALSPFYVTGFRGFDPALFPVPQDRPPVQPAGYAFSIWGLIYAWLVVHAGYGLLQRDENRDWDATRWPLLVSLGLGASWLQVAMTSPVLATVQIWLMLAAALIALWRSPRADRWLAQAPLAIYAGWLTAASCVSLGLLLAGYGLTGALPAAVLALALAVALAALVQTALGRAPEYGLAVIWALVAVAVANAATLWLAALAILGAAVVAATSWRLGR